MTAAKDMTANYHTHTTRCHHAVGTEREYVENAIRGGLKILGFSDHAPMPYPDGFVSGVRMTFGEFDGYVDTVLSLRDEYRSDIEIHLGLEAEYYPPLFEEFLDRISGYPVEYLLLGQHFLGNETEGPYAGHETRDPAILALYCDQCIAGMKTGAYSYLAHPDMINFIGDENLYETRVRGLCEAAKECGVPLEINLLGLTLGRHYPNPAFWRIAGKVGNDVVIACDAHRPDMVWNPEGYRKALELAASCGLNVLDTVTLIRPSAGRTADGESGRDRAAE